METSPQSNAVASRTAAGMAASPPFDAGRLDELMEQAGLDALVLTSKHNIQYLLGGYRFFFFDHFDAIGVSRYLPILVYVKGRPERSSYIGHPMESYERELNRFWVPNFHPSARTSTDGIELAVAQLLTIDPKRIGVEPSCLPTPRACCAPECRGRSWSRRRFRSNGCARSKRRRSWSICASPPISSSIPCSR
jgi:hypothetical protein